ncbi:unnamed protein product [marine sediment metagenome]|uniref:PNPLA domain-containing protein n=1 Tax=marine sediment metagenome TaxID=412755 RepID=X0YU38_9ZZZZ
MVDGGLRDNIPVKEVVEQKKSDFVLIVLCSPLGYLKVENKKFKGVIEISSRAISTMIDETMKNDLEMITRINEIIKKGERGTDWLASKKIIDINTISPTKHLSGELLSFGQKELREGFEAGRKSSSEFLRKTGQI